MSAVKILPSGELEVTARASLDDGIAAALTRAFAALRASSSRENVAHLGRDQGYRVEDLSHLDVRGISVSTVAEVLAWLRRRLPPQAVVTCHPGDGPFELLARLDPRAPEHARAYRVGDDGRV